MKLLRRGRTVIATAGIVALTALVVVVIIRPRFVQLETATTDPGGTALFVIALLLALAALTPLAALGRTKPWKAAALCAVALALGSALALSFGQRDSSDGLFVFALLVGSGMILALSVGLTVRLRSDAP